MGPFETLLAFRTKTPGGPYLFAALGSRAGRVPNNSRTVHGSPQNGEISAGADRAPCRREWISKPFIALPLTLSAAERLSGRVN